MLLGQPAGGPVGRDTLKLRGPFAAALMGELIASRGRQFLLVDRAGSLRVTVSVGSLVLPGELIREEGTSYHYVPAEVRLATTPRLNQRIRDMAAAPQVPEPLGQAVDDGRCIQLFVDGRGGSRRKQHGGKSGGRRRRPSTSAARPRRSPRHERQGGETRSMPSSFTWWPWPPRRCTCWGVGCRISVERPVREGPWGVCRCDDDDERRGDAWKRRWDGEGTSSGCTSCGKPVGAEERPCVVHRRSRGVHECTAGCTEER